METETERRNRMKIDTLFRTLELGWGIGTVAGVALVTFLSIVIAWLFLCAVLVASFNAALTMRSERKKKESFAGCAPGLGPKKGGSRE
jgi:hypothetical protein